MLSLKIRVAECRRHHSLKRLTFRRQSQHPCCLASVAARNLEVNANLDFAALEAAH
jgi:hypothetical protein